MRILTRYILKEVTAHALIGAAIFTFVLFTRRVPHPFALFAKGWVAQTSNPQGSQFCGSHPCKRRKGEAPSVVAVSGIRGWSTRPNQRLRTQFFLELRLL